MEAFGFLVLTVSAIGNITGLWLENRRIEREFDDYKRWSSEAILKLESKVSALEIQMENRP